jgi:uncharacterized protein
MLFCYNNDSETVSEFLIKTVNEKLPGSHDDSHINRTLRFAKQIQAVHEANWKIIEAALELHEETKNNPKSVDSYLPDFSQEEIGEVAYCIEKHYDYINKPTTLEGKIVQDCDILDMLGAVGIARAFMASGEKGLKLLEAEKEYKKKRLMLFDQLNLEESKKIAKDKASFTKLFFETIEGEL